MFKISKIKIDFLTFYNKKLKNMLKSDKKVINLNDPIQARVNENKYFFKRRTRKVHPENTKVQNKIITRSTRINTCNKDS